nr:hypothetical protein Iba_chr12bCG3540 [Ipomoea batatas]
MESLPHVPHPSLPQSSPPRCHAVTHHAHALKFLASSLPHPVTVSPLVLSAVGTLPLSVSSRSATSIGRYLSQSRISNLSISSRSATSLAHRRHRRSESITQASSTRQKNSRNLARISRIRHLLVAYHCAFLPAKRVPNCRSASLPRKKRRKRSPTCCCSRRKKWRNEGEQRRRNREAEGLGKSLQLAESQGGLRRRVAAGEKKEKRRRTTPEKQRSRGVGEVAAARKVAGRSEEESRCCRNFAPLAAAGRRRRDWRSRLFPSPSGRRLFW